MGFVHSVTGLFVLHADIVSQSKVSRSSSKRELFVSGWRRARRGSSKPIQPVDRRDNRKSRALLHVPPNTIASRRHNVSPRWRRLKNLEIHEAIDANALFGYTGGCISCAPIKQLNSFVMFLFKKQLQRTFPI